MITTFTDPSLVGGDAFGWSMAATSSGRVPIGAYKNNTGTNAAGVVYLFSTNGTLLTTFTNPTPANSDYFGYSLTLVGSDRALIGAYRDSTGPSGTPGHELGAAYLFSLESFTPPLTVTHSGGTVIVSWSRAADGFVLDQTSAIVLPPAVITWSQLSTATYQTNATSVFISLPAPVGNKFYRLRKP